MYATLSCMESIKISNAGEDADRTDPEGLSDEKQDAREFNGKVPDLLSDHDLGRLNGDAYGITKFEGHVLDRTLGDGRHEFKVADLHSHFCHRRPIRDMRDRSLELIACTELHDLHPHMVGANRHFR